MERLESSHSVKSAMDHYEPRARQRGAAGAGARQHPLSRMQGWLGNREVSRLLRQRGPSLQRACACEGSSESCEACEGSELLARSPASTNQPASVPRSVRGVLQSPGRPLDSGARSFFESRLGHDLGRVRIHTGGAAAASARAVHAQAYTVGRHVVFGSGHYGMRSASGRRLLAHELVHTIQQRSVGDIVPDRLEVSSPADASEWEADRIADRAVSGAPSPAAIGSSGARLQRACGPRAIGDPSGCEPFGTVSTEQIFSVPTERFLFRVNCDDFSPRTERDRLRALVPTIRADQPVDLHGFASEEGDAAYNQRLACARAHKARAELLAAGLPEARLRDMYTHGATAFGTRAVNRSVVIPLAEPPTLFIVPPGAGGLRADQRRAAASCSIDCGDRTLGTLNVMPLFFHESRTAIVAPGSATATGVGASLHFTETALDIPTTDPCHCDDYRVIQVITTTHPAAGRVSPYVDNAGLATPFYDAVYLSGEGIHPIPGGYPDAGERVQSTISIYDRPYRATAGNAGQDIRWEAEACVACIRSQDPPDRILGCATYGFARSWNAGAGTHDPLTAIGPGCRAAPSADFLDALRTDPTTAGYDFVGK